MKKCGFNAVTQVLIVDDDALDCENLTALLEEEGCMCYQVGNTLEALGVLEAGWLGKLTPIKVIIADLHIDGLYGLDILGHIKTHWRFPTAQVIVLMREMNDTLWLAAKQAGAYAIFTKPCNFDDLQRVIQQIINGREDELEGLR